MSYTNPPPIPVPPVEALRASAMKLTAELDQAKLHQAAAYVAMAVEAMAKAPEAAVNDNVYRSDVECEFEVDEYGRVWMYRDGDAHIIGRKDYIRTEMWRSSGCFWRSRSRPAQPAGEVAGRGRLPR